MVSDVSPVAPGQTFHVVVVFKIEPKWHIYWKNPGEGAMPPRIALEVPPGFEVAPLRWPRPTLVETTIGPEYCYYDEVALFVPVKAPPHLDGGQAALELVPVGAFVESHPEAELGAGEEHLRLLVVLDQRVGDLAVG